MSTMGDAGRGDPAFYFSHGTPMYPGPEAAVTTLTTTLRPPRPLRSAAPLFAVTVVWLAVATAAGVAGVFERQVGEPPLKLAVAVGLPVGGVAVALVTSPRFRAWAETLDLGLLVNLQAWRVLGFAFLAAYAQGVLPGAFAWPAGLGDLAVGLAAPFVAVHVAHRARSARTVFRCWTAFGILDFVVALALGVATNIGARGVLPDGSLSQAPIYDLPLSLIPTFAVPFLLVVHLLSLARARPGM
jgi:hypothetical protein